MTSNKPKEKLPFLISGGILASFVASLCCVGPLLLTLLGISGAAVLAKLDIIRIPLIIIISIFFIGTGYYLYHKRKTCEPGSFCADPKKFKVMIIFYWVGIVVSILLITSPYWLAWILT